MWNHFETLEGDKAKCGYCSAQLSLAEGNISNLKRHLTTKHPTVPINRNRDILNRNVNNVEPNEFLPNISRGVVSQSVSALNMLSQATHSTPPTILPSQRTPPSIVWPSQRTLSVVLPSQRPITDFLENRRPITAIRKKQLDEQIIKMIVKK